MPKGVYERIPGSRPAQSAATREKIRAKRIQYFDRVGRIERSPGDCRRGPKSPAHAAKLREVLARVRGFSGVKGWHDSPKSLTGRVPFRSRDPEKFLMEHFDQDPTVICWQYEPFRIPFGDSYTTPDFLVTYQDGVQRVVEGKARWCLEDYLQSSKYVVTRDYCRSNGFEFVVVVEGKVTGEVTTG
jgi:hypothetical protein